MGQVPRIRPQTRPHYLLIGSGRLARHLASYFKSKNLAFDTWSRKSSDSVSLSEYLEHSDIVLLAISDQAISTFYEDLIKTSPHLEEKIWVHFSGALSHPKILSFHPLMSFGPDLYDLSTYQNIPFVTENSKNPFAQVFPQLENPSYVISPEKKALYHSYCVMSGNFTQLLWWMVEESFSTDLGLPPKTLLPYKTQIFANALKGSRQALTGPLVRNDQETIQKHLSALPLEQAELYRQFVSLFKTLNTASENNTEGGSHEHHSI